MYLQLIILITVSLVICFRKCFPFRIPVWVIMSIGALISLLYVRFSFTHTLNSIKWDVIFYLIGIFFIVEAAESSGFLSKVTTSLFSKFKEPKQILFIIVFVLGSISAIALNDTTAILGVPIILKLCKNNRQLITPFMLALAFSITIGSVMSPIGNPQNLLIASQSHIDPQFWTFLKNLAIPTIICLTIVYYMISILCKKELNSKLVAFQEKTKLCYRSSSVIIISITIFITLIATKIILSTLQSNQFNLEFGTISIISAVPVLIFGKKRFKNIKSMDWGTVIFFIAMFILMQNVWDSGFFQYLIKNSHINISSMPSIFIISITLSQLMSNVPLVTLYLPILAHTGANTMHYMALAASSTIAGNIYILGAASTIIIIQNSEKNGIYPFRTITFSLIGIPLTILTAGVYYLFIMYF
ncbi:MAG TPA: SLC13 family permease [Victivallales bacterium]|nr:SLC13 family permease [Victivallales bacterium]